MTKPKISLEMLETFNKCKDTPEQATDSDREILIQYGLTLDNIQLADYIKELTTLEEGIWTPIVKDPRFLDYTHKLIEQEQEKVIAREKWGKRPSGIN